MKSKTLNILLMCLLLAFCGNLSLAQAADSSNSPSPQTRNPHINEIINDIGTFVENNDCDSAWRLLWKNRNIPNFPGYSIISYFATFGIHPFGVKSTQSNLDVAFGYAVIAEARKEIKNIDNDILYMVFSANREVVSKYVRKKRQEFTEKGYLYCSRIQFDNSSCLTEYYSKNTNKIIDLIALTDTAVHQKKSMISCNFR